MFVSKTISPVVVNVFPLKVVFNISNEFPFNVPLALISPEAVTFLKSANGLIAEPTAILPPPVVES